MNPGILEREGAILLIVDVQERFRPVIADFDLTVANIVKLAKGFKILGLPVIVTEQYPKGLGRTIPEIRQATDVKPFEKLSFSCLQEPGFDVLLEKYGRRQLVVCGIEAHICLLNTTLEALERDYEVHYVVDAVSSRRLQDKEIAVNRVTQAGAYQASTEIVLFQLLKKAGTGEFKEISKIVK
jgi:nicotinamidase-related amidase